MLFNIKKHLNDIMDMIYGFLIIPIFLIYSSFSWKWNDEKCYQTL